MKLSDLGEGLLNYGPALHSVEVSGVLRKLANGGNSGDATVCLLAALLLATKDVRKTLLDISAQQRQMAMKSETPVVTIEPPAVVLANARIACWANDKRQAIKAEKAAKAKAAQAARAAKVVAAAAAAESALAANSEATQKMCESLATTPTGPEILPAQWQELPPGIRDKLQTHGITHFSQLDGEDWLRIKGMGSSSHHRVRIWRATHDEEYRDAHLSDLLPFVPATLK